jgi:hypothetical protein
VVHAALVFLQSVYLVATPSALDVERSPVLELGFKASDIM